MESKTSGRGHRLAQSGSSVGLLRLLNLRVLRALRQAMPIHRARVLEGKNTLLWEAMLKEYSFPDLRVVDLMKLGVDLSGQVPASGVFEPCFKPATDDISSLSERAPLPVFRDPLPTMDLIASKRTSFRKAGFQPQ